MELISTREASRACYIAPTWKEAYECIKSGATIGSPKCYTHMVPHPQLLLGLSASTIPFFPHNQGPRTTYFSNMKAQAVGISRLNTMVQGAQGRMDGQAYQMWYLQRPLVVTEAEVTSGTLPQGFVPMVAVMDDPSNFEDALTIRKSFAERGGARVSIIITMRETERTGAQDREEVCNPLIDDPIAGKTLNVAHDADYSKLEDDGTPPVGTWIVKGDIVIGKIMKTATMLESGVLATARYDISKQYRGEDDCIVDQVMRTTSKSGRTMIAVRLRTTRSILKGDKFASRHGQKGTIGDIKPDVDCPFVMSGPNRGMIPDLFFTPYAKPSRMTGGHDGEGVASLIAAKTGKIMNGTPWRYHRRDGGQTHEMRELLEILHKECQHGEKVEMCCGITGRRLRARIVLTPMFYVRLQHMVKSKWRARDTGPKTQLTQ